MPSPILSMQSTTDAGQARRADGTYTSMLDSDVKELIEKRFGKAIRYSSDIEALSLDIERRTRLPMSVNTLKRLWGMVRDVKNPRLFTLDVIAKYIGYDTWDDLQQRAAGEQAVSGFDEIAEINMDDVDKGDQILFEYDPDRKVTCEHLHGNLFVVRECLHGKLREGDVIKVNHFILNYPLIVEDVIRDGRSLGRFTAGRSSGLTKIKLVRR